MALKPLHDHLFKSLENIPSDCTYDQSKGLQLALSEGTKVSADLTAATDRFPMELQERLISKLSSPSFGEA